MATAQYAYFEYLQMIGWRYIGVPHDPLGFQCKICVENGKYPDNIGQFEKCSTKDCKKRIPKIGFNPKICRRLFDL